MKFEYNFFDPEVCSVCELWKAKSIILKGRQGTLRSNFWYSKISVFSFMEVLLNFLKYLTSNLFPRIVMSALIGLVLYLCHDFSCLMTGSRFWCFRNNSSVTFSVLEGKCFHFLFLIKVLYLGGHGS